MEAHPGAKAYLGSVKAYPEAEEVQPGTIKAQQRLTLEQ